MKKFATLLVVAVLSVSVLAKTGKEIIQENGFKPKVEPLLVTHWSQDGDENSMLPIVNVEEGIRAAAGCGATAVAQIMKFWNFPTHGIGYNYYYWDTISGQEQVLYADFENTTYDWTNMIAKYKGNSNTTQQQIDAVSTLMAHIGTALEMKYDYSHAEQKPTTATQIEYIHSALKKYFGYNSNMYIVRYINGAYSMDEWLTMIYSELSEGRPVLMGGRYTNSKGEYADHIYVADGYDENGNVHLNLGKAGIGFNQDTYYDLTETGKTYTENMRMILGISPYKLDATVNTVNVQTPGTLIDVLGGELNSKRFCRLKITGYINNDDIKLLEKLTAVTTGQLSYLDLSECTLEGDIIKDHSFNECYTLQEILLPSNVTEIREAAFYGCRGLLSIGIPDNLKFLERYSLMDCRYLSKIELPQSLNRIDNNPFSRVKLDELIINEANPYFKVQNNTIFSKNGKKLQCMAGKFKGKYIIPEGVENLTRYTFDGCHMIDSLIIPSTIKNLGTESFRGCEGLKHVFCYSTSAPNHYAAFPYSSSRILHIPHGCADDYINKGWKDMFGVIIEDLESTASISDTRIPQGNNWGTKIYDVSGKETKQVRQANIYIYKDNKGNTSKKFIKF